MHALVAVLRRKAALSEARHLEDQQRLRYFRKLAPLFDRLRAAGFGSADEVIQTRLCSVAEFAQQFRHELITRYAAYL